MARNRLSLHDESEPGHGNRPWVYFMIDSFFLITQFFVLTFHLPSNEAVLPQEMHGDTRGVSRLVVEPIRVHVTRAEPARAPAYQVLVAGDRRDHSLAQFNDYLHATASARPGGVSVQVSYDAQLPFGDVMNVFNLCRKYNVERCGLLPLRAP
jgi:biopolymer transport protein ExbD